MRYLLCKPRLFHAAFFILGLLFIVCACDVSQATALSRELHQKMVKESPDFYQAEVELSNAWKAMMEYMQGEARATVLAEQRIWLRTERDAHAKSLKEQYRIADTQAYVLATTVQANKIALLLKQVSGATSKTLLTGDVVSGHNEAGYYYAFRTLGSWQTYNIGYIWDFSNNLALGDSLAKLVDSDTKVQVSGVLTSLHNLTLEEVVRGGKQGTSQQPEAPVSPAQPPTPSPTHRAAPECTYF